MAQQTFEFIFWSSFITLLYIYFGYPLILFLASKILKPVFTITPLDKLPLITILIPVHNEESIIEKKIINTLELNYPSKLIEIVVTSDGSTDHTNEIIKSYESKGIKVFIHQTNEGKNAVINKTSPLTKGDILLFTDANAIFSHDALKNIVAKFSDPQVGCVGGTLKYSDGESLSSKGEGFYFRYENMIRKLEGLQGTMVGANGAIYALRRELFTPVPPHVPNDFFHPLSVLKKGFYSVFDEKAIAFEKPTEDQKEEFNRRKRIVARSFGAISEINRLYGIFHGRGWFHIVSHKILRWFAFPIVLTALLSNIFLVENSIYHFLLGIQLFFFASGILGYILNIFGYKVKVFYIPYYFLLINLAGISGLYSYFKGDKVIKWNAASTTR